MAGKNGKKIVHHTYMSAKDAHYVGELVNGARIVVQWGDVGTELMVCVDGDISLFLGYENIRFTAPVYVGDFMEYTGEIIDIGVLLGIIEKSGAWFSYNGNRIGQGKDNARKYLESEPGILAEIEEKIRAAAKDADIVEQFEIENEDDLDIRDFDEEEL